MKVQSADKTREKINLSHRSKKGPSLCKLPITSVSLRAILDTARSVLSHRAGYDAGEQRCTRTPDRPPRLSARELCSIRGKYWQYASAFPQLLTSAVIPNFIRPVNVVSILHNRPPGVGKGGGCQHPRGWFYTWFLFCSSNCIRSR